MRNQLSKMDRSVLSCILVVALFAASIYGSQEPLTDLKTGGYCPQEMCFFVFDRLEEQTQRMRIVEETLRRMVTLFSSVEPLAALSETLKSDPVISSLFAAEETHSVPESPDWTILESVLLSSHEDATSGSSSSSNDKIVDNYIVLKPTSNRFTATGRKKRELSADILEARMKVAAALNQASGVFKINFKIIIFVLIYCYLFRYCIMIEALYNSKVFPNIVHGSK